MNKPNNQFRKLELRILQAISALPDTGHVEKPTVESILAELKQLQNEFKQFDYNSDSATVSVTTNPITLGNIYLGPFRIQLNIDRIAHGSPAEYFDVIAMEPQPAAENRWVTHPHVRGGKLCTGDATVRLSVALTNGWLCDFFLIIRSVLETYNPDSPYVPLEDWVNYNLCYDCGSHIQPSETHFCPLCGELFCRNCFGCISCCSSRICKICLTHMQYSTVISSNRPTWRYGQAFSFSSAMLIAVISSTMLSSFL